MSPPKTEDGKQKLIQEFREKIFYIKSGYWTTDEYICKWLEDKNYKVDVAEKAFRKMIKWRVENNLETVLDENLDDLYDENIIYYLDGIDKKGRPVLCLPYQLCNVRDKLNKGEKSRIERVFYQVLEKMVQLIKKSSLESNGAINTFVVIVDVDGVDVKLITPQVISLIVEVSNLCQNNYPGMLECAYIINASKPIKNIYTLIKPTLQSAITNRIKMFSNKRYKWEPIILENIQGDQIRLRFGGTMDDTIQNQNCI